MSMIQPTPAPVAAPVRPRYLAPTAPTASATLLGRAIAAAGSSFPQCAAALGVSESRVRALAEGWDRLARLPRGVRRAFAHLLTADSVPAVGLAPLAHLARLTKEVGEAAAAVIEAGEEIDAAERAEIDRELADVAAEVERMRRDLAEVGGGQR